MLLYEHPVSSYAQKVKIALREKGVVLDVGRRKSTSLGAGLHRQTTVMQEWLV